MSGLRRARTGFALVAALGMLAGSSEVGAPRALPDLNLKALSGWVRDAAGRDLAGVQVLLTDPTAGAPPLAAATTDQGGRFRLAHLVPGAYRISALKQGYLGFVGAVNLAVQDTVQLVLYPAAEAAAGEPHSDSWALRVPRRGVLHETADGLPDPLRGPSDASGADALRVQVDQLFSVRAAASGATSESPALDATETLLTLDSSVGDEAKLRLQGRRERLGSESGELSSGARASQAESFLGVQLSLAPAPADRLALDAYYSDDRYDLFSAATASAGLLQSGQRSQGYQAHWLRQIDAASRVAVAVDYQDTLLVAGLERRAIAAEGSYAAVASPQHELQLALGTRLLGWPSTSTSPSVEFDARDRWSIAAPFALLYGLGGRQTLVDDGNNDTTLLVPQLGASWERAGFHARGLVFYHERGFGYEGDFELPLIEGLRLVGQASHAPEALPGMSAAPTALDPLGPPLWISAADTAVSAGRLSLVESRGEAETFLELEAGRAVGSLMPLLPFHALDPALGLSSREVRYGNARWGLRLPSRGTDLSAEYHWASARAVATASPKESDAVEQSVELRLIQQVPGLHLPGEWRMLLALRLGAVDVAGASDLEADDLDTLAALNRRIGAGMSVLF